MNGQFDATDEELYQCDWYSFPMDMQKMVLIFMMGTQEPVFIRGFGNIECTRDAFKKVLFLTIKIIFTDQTKITDFVFLSKQTIHGGFSYFMTLRQLYGY